MQATAIAELVTDTACAVLPRTVPPSLMMLPPHTLVTAEVWSEDRHCQITGEALYAVHRGDRAEWAIIVIESSHLEPGAVQVVDLADIRVVTRAGRRGG